MIYTLTEAAVELDIPEEGFKLLLQLGLIRYAFPKTLFSNYCFIDEDYLPSGPPQKQSVPVDQITYFPDTCPDYLYKSFPAVGYTLSPLKEIYAATNQIKALKTDWIEEFDGTLLHFLNKDLKSTRVEIPFPVSEDQILTNSLFSSEELARFKTVNKHSFLLFKDRSTYYSTPLPFTLPKRADDPCRAIVDMGNLYFKKHRTIPQPVTLRKFMIQNKETDWMVIDKPNNQRRVIEIEDHAMSYDSFNKRYQQYLRG